MTGQDEAKSAGTTRTPKDTSHLRLMCLDLALRMDHTHHSDVVRAAHDFEKFVIGEKEEATNG